MNNPKVSVIFVNYKTPQMTADAINSVKEKTKDVTYEIIVVDNSCDENEYQELVKCINDENILIIDAKDNLGFGKANNLGSKYAKGEFLFFLNTDTLPINDAISILANFLDNNINAGIVGGNLYTKDLKPNHSFIKKEKNVNNEIKEESLSVYIKKLLFKTRRDFNYNEKPLKILGYVCGAALMIRKKLFDELNGFDRDIFMYAEESLLCYRAIHEQNIDIYNVPSAKIIHFDGGSLSNFTEFKAKINIDGNYIYYKKAFGDEIASKYLSELSKKYKRKVKLFKIIKNDEKRKQCLFLINAIDNKLKEIGE